MKAMACAFPVHERLWPAAMEGCRFPRAMMRPGDVSRTTTTKSQRYREILAVLTRHGIGIVDDEFIKHESGIKRVRSIFAAHVRNSERYSSSWAGYCQPAAICYRGHIIAMQQIWIELTVRRRRRRIKLAPNRAG